MLQGPVDSVYQTVTIKLNIVILKDFPFSKPTITYEYPFTDENRPPHFYPDGRICCHSNLNNVSVHITTCIQHIREVMFEPTSIVVSKITEEEVEEYAQKQSAVKDSLKLICNHS